MRAFVGTEAVKEIEQRLIVGESAAFLVHARDLGAPKSNHAAWSLLRAQRRIPTRLRVVKPHQRRGEIILALNECNDAW